MIMPFEGLQDPGQAEVSPYLSQVDEDAYCDGVLPLLDTTGEVRATLRDIKNGGFAF